MTDVLLDDLRAAVGVAHVLTDPDLTFAYGLDWTGRFGVRPHVVVRPADTAQVANVMRACSAHDVPIVVQGGNTGLVGGGVPHDEHTVLLSTTRLTWTGDVEVEDRQVTVGAGLPLGTVQALAAASGLAYGVDLAARDSATIGGTAATNAGGLRVVAFGTTRRNVVGIEAVLPDGQVVRHLPGAMKDSAGYDLANLFVGSEGTLGVITAVQLRLVEPLPSERMSVLCGVPDFAEALRALRALGRDAAAAEFIGGSALDLVCEVTGLPFPLRSRASLYVLLEAPASAMQRAVHDNNDVISDRRVWQYRERLTEAVSTLGRVHKLDVGVPLSRLQELLDCLPAVTAPHTVHAFGHLAEGNVHVEVVGPAPDDDEVDDRVLRLVARLGGSISAEHGVGRAKTRWLHLARDAAYVETMRRIKTALDPHGLLNPGVLLPR